MTVNENDRVILNIGNYPIEKDGKSFDAIACSEKLRLLHKMTLLWIGARYPYDHGYDKGFYYIDICESEMHRQISLPIKKLRKIINDLKTMGYIDIKSSTNNEGRIVNSYLLTEKIFDEYEQQLIREEQGID